MEIEEANTSVNHIKIGLEQLENNTEKIKITINTVDNAQTLNPKVQPIHTFMAAKFNCKASTNLLVKGFTPGAEFNILCMNQKGFRTYAVKGSSVEFVSESSFSQEVLDSASAIRAAYDPLGMKFDLVGATLLVKIEPYRGNSKYFGLMLDPATGACYKEVKLEKEMVKLLSLNNNFLENGSLNLKKNSQNHYNGRSLSKNEQHPEITNVEFGDFSRQKFKASFKIRHPTVPRMRQQKRDHSIAIGRLDFGLKAKLNNIVKSSTFTDTRYSLQKKDLYVFVSTGMLSMFITVYNYITRKILFRSDISMRDLVGLEISEYLTTKFTCQIFPAKPIFVPEANRLVFIVETPECLRLLSLKVNLWNSKPHVVRRSFDCPETLERRNHIHFEPLVKLIYRKNQPLIFILSDFDQYAFGKYESDFACIVHPETLETVIDLTGYLLANPRIKGSVQNLRDVKFLGDGDKLLLLYDNHSEIVSLAKEEYLRVLNFTHYNIGFDQNAQLISVEDAVYWKDKNKIWIAKIKEEENEGKLGVKIIKMEKIDLIQPQTFIKDPSASFEFLQCRQFDVALLENKDYLLSVIVKGEDPTTSVFKQQLVMLQINSETLGVTDAQNLALPKQMQIGDKFLVGNLPERLVFSQIERQYDFEDKSLVLEIKDFLLPPRETNYKVQDQNGQSSIGREIQVKPKIDSLRTLKLRNLTYSNLRFSNFLQEGFVCLAQADKRNYLIEFDLKTLNIKRCKEVEIQEKITALIYFGQGRVALHAVPESSLNIQSNVILFNLGSGEYVDLGQIEGVDNGQMFAHNAKNNLLLELFNEKMLRIDISQ